MKLSASVIIFIVVSCLFTRCQNSAVKNKADSLKNDDQVKKPYKDTVNVDMNYIEKDLLKAYSKINKYIESADNYREKEDSISMNKIVDYAADSVNYADSLLEAKLLFYTSNYPKTLTYKFKLIDTPLCIITSSDSIFRIYTWDDMLGGTERFNANIFQFNAAGKVQSCKFKINSKDEDRLAYVTNECDYIYTLKSGDKKYYLVTLSDKWSGRDRYEGIIAFKINISGLDTAQIIKTNTGLKNSIGYSYDFFSKNSENSISYNDDTKNIYLPIVLNDANGNGRKTNKYMVYHFNGQFFESIKK
jgi:hypothetical protein